MIKVRVLDAHMSEITLENPCQQIEKPNGGDDSRAIGPHCEQSGESSYFMSVNRGKYALIAASLDVTAILVQARKVSRSICAKRKARGFFASLLPRQMCVSRTSDRV